MNKMVSMRDIEAQQRTTAVVLAIFDAVLLLVAGVAASWIRFPVRFGHELSLLLQHPGFIVYAIAVLWCLGSTFDLFRPENWRSREQLAVRLAALAVALPIGLALGTYVVLPWRFGRGLLALTVLLTVPLMWMVRTFWIATFRWRPRSAVVVGDGPIVKALTEELERRSSPPFVIGQHLRMPEVHQLEGKARDTLAANDLVIVANLSAPEAFERLAELNFLGTSVIDAAGAYAALTGRIPVLQVDAGWFIATGDFSSIATSPFHRVQRILDVVAGALYRLSGGRATSALEKFYIEQHFLYFAPDTLVRALERAGLERVELRRELTDLRRLHLGAGSRLVLETLFAIARRTGLENRLYVLARAAGDGAPG